MGRYLPVILYGVTGPQLETYLGHGVVIVLPYMVPKTGRCRRAVGGGHGWRAGVLNAV